MKTTTLALAAAMAASTLAHAQEAVQWRVEDGGNGHWYAVVSVPGTCIDDIRAVVLGFGGDLASVESLEENEVIRQRLESLPFIPDRCVIGLVPFEAESGDDPADWYWLDGSSGSFQNWATWSNEPGDYPGIHEPIASMGVEHGGWSDVACGGSGEFTAAIEWSADCNGDGIVDYGQILDGTFADMNANGVPDTCECLADVNQDGVVNGADISAVLGFWGQAGKPLPAADITRDGLVDGADIAVLLGSWGECP